MEWEMRAIRSLKAKCPEYGWEVDGPQYKARLKLIQREATARHKAAILHLKQASAGRAVRTTCDSSNFDDESALKRPKPRGWEQPSQPLNGRSFQSFIEAKSMLGKPPFSTVWARDKECPGSGTQWRRFISADETNPHQFKRARIILAKGFHHTSSSTLHAHDMFM